MTPILKTRLILAGIAVGITLLGTILGVSLGDKTTPPLPDQTECTTNSIGCVLDQLLRDLIPLLIFTAGELTENPPAGSEEPTSVGKEVDIHKDIN